MPAASSTSAADSPVSAGCGEARRRIASGGEQVALRLWWPEPLPPAPPLLLCLPGGGMTAGYFDLRVAGNDSHSFARAMAARGLLVAAVDLPGTGDSSGGEDLYRHTPEQLADIIAGLVAPLAAAWRSGEVSGRPVLPAGCLAVGHSMGAMLATLAQARHAVFGGLALLGFGTAGLPQYLPPALAERLRTDRQGVLAEQVTLARQFFAAAGPDRGRGGQRKAAPDGGERARLFAGEAAEADGVRALADCAAPILPVPALRAMLPGNVASEAAAITVPVLLATGERDMVGPPRALAAAFPASRAVSLYELPGAGHSHFLFPARRELFNRLAQWASAVTGDPA